MTGANPTSKTAGKPSKRSQKKMDKLQAAMKKLKKGSENDVDLFALPVSRPGTGTENRTGKMKLLKAAIHDAHRGMWHGATLMGASLPATQEDERAEAAAAAEQIAESSPSEATTPAHKTHLPSHTRPDSPTQWKLVVPQNPKAAKKAATRARQGTAKLETSTAALENAGVATPETQKPNKEAKQAVVAAIAAFSGEAESVIEAEARNRCVEANAGVLPTRPAFDGDDLGLPVDSLFATLKQQTQLEIAADGREKQQIAKERALARNDCVKELARHFPAETMMVRITLIGHAFHSRTSLLGLPEKIQEQIYRPLLVEDGPFRITPSHYKQPALLRTCRQLRIETLWIFEMENTFSIEVVDSQAVVPKNYTSHWARQVDCKLETTGVPKWDNFKKWLRAYHEDGVLGLNSQRNDGSMPWDICAQAFKLVTRLREIFPSMTFEEMEPMLEVWKKTVALQQVSWSWD